MINDIINYDDYITTKADAVKYNNCASTPVLRQPLSNYGKMSRNASPKKKQLPTLPTINEGKIFVARILRIMHSLYMAIDINGLGRHEVAAVGG
jgi:hypothetical protein